MTSNNMAFFLIFQYGFKPLRSTVGLLIVVLIELLGFLINLGLLELQGVIFKAFNRICHADFFLKLKLKFGLYVCFFLFLSNKPHRVVLDGTFTQEYPVNPGVPQGSIPCPTCILQALMTCNTPVLDSNLRDTMDWKMKQLGDLNAGKT